MDKSAEHAQQTASLYFADRRALLYQRATRWSRGGTVDADEFEKRASKCFDVLYTLSSHSSTDAWLDWATKSVDDFIKWHDHVVALRAGEQDQRARIEKDYAEWRSTFETSMDDALRGNIDQFAAPKQVLASAQVAQLVELEKQAAIAVFQREIAPVLRERVDARLKASAASK
jgi:hypothetical protein